MLAYSVTINCRCSLEYDEKTTDRKHNNKAEEEEDERLSDRIKPAVRSSISDG